MQRNSGRRLEYLKDFKQMVPTGMLYILLYCTLWTLIICKKKNGVLYVMGAPALS